MLVELELIVTLCTKMALVSNPTLLELTVTMQLTAISKRRAKLKGLVTLQEQPLLLHQIPVLQDVPTLQAPALQALQQALGQPHLPLEPLPLHTVPHQEYWEGLAVALVLLGLAHMMVMVAL